MIFGSLFSGIGGFDLALERAGMRCAWQCEIDKAASGVLARHWPNVTRYEDVKTVGKHNLQSVDVICGGFPCQDLSIAGKREGLAGERSGLFYEFIRIVSELRPMWVVVENVPGLLSSNNGKDIQIVIDSFTQIGYTVDIDIKDAQEFGVAQRRRRVFLTCVKLDGLLQKRTNLSRQISADLLAQILLNAWGATRQASSLVPLHLVFEKPIERSVNFLRKMTSLLRITREILACKKYQNDLDVLLDQFGGEGKNSEYGSIRKSGIQKGENSGETDMFPSEPKAENGDTNISLWLSEYLDAVCETESQFTTSILRNRITDHQIYTFAVMALTIAERILLSIDWSESCWSVASSFSILLQESTNYARQASRNLFIEPGLRDGWRDYLGTASRIQGEFERHLGAIHERQVLFERTGVFRNTPARRKAGEETAFTLGGNSRGSIQNGDGDVNGNLIGFTPRRTNYDGVDDLAPTLNVGSGGFGAPGIAGTVSSKWAKGTGGPAGDEVQNLVWDFHQQDGSYRPQDETAPTVAAKRGTGGNNMPFVGVRRLTPVECERLQGFPDGHTDGQSDSGRYKQLGNAVAVPVAEWIARRIVESGSVA